MNTTALIVNRSQHLYFNGLPTQLLHALTEYQLAAFYHQVTTQGESVFEGKFRNGTTFVVRSFSSHDCEQMDRAIDASTSIAYTPIEMHRRVKLYQSANRQIGCQPICIGEFREFLNNGREWVEVVDVNGEPYQLINTIDNDEMQECFDCGLVEITQ